MRLRQRKVDANQKEIIAALRKCGVTVLSLHQVGHGAPDFAAGAYGKNFFFEVKSDKKAKLTDDERVFHATWNGQVSVVTSVEEALRVIGGK